MIKLAVHSTIIYIDHGANSIITNQIKLSSINVDKLNLKFVKISIYLSQFRLNIRHQSNKLNVISNVFNKFSVKTKKLKTKIDLKHYHDDMKNSKWTNNYALNETLIGINDGFKNRIISEYVKKEIWTKIIQILKFLNEKWQKKQSTLEENNTKMIKIDINFVLKKRFVYHYDDEKI